MKDFKFDYDEENDDLFIYLEGKKSAGAVEIGDFIVDFDLDVHDTVLLHPTNFDEIVLEFRDTYKESIQVPFFLIGILIKEDSEKKIPINRVGLIKNDPDLGSIRNTAFINDLIKNH